MPSIWVCWVVVGRGYPKPASIAALSLLQLAIQKHKVALDKHIAVIFNKDGKFGSYDLHDSIAEHTTTPYHCMFC
jgi:hypothetical protein